MTCDCTRLQPADPGARGPRPFALPGAEPRYARDREIDIHHIRLDVTVDIEKRRIDGMATIKLGAIGDLLKRIELDAVELDIKAAHLTSLGGDILAPVPLRFENTGTKLRIELPRPLAGGEAATLRIEYGATPRRGFYFVGPDEMHPAKPRQAWTQGQDEDSRYWFPCYDYPNEKATSEVVATVAEPYIAISNGALVELTEDEQQGTRTWHWSQNVRHVAYLITLVVGEFVEIREDLNGVPITYYVTRGREADAKRSLGKTPQMVQVFSELTGIPYPYEKYAQVCVADFIFGGMENTSATTLTDKCLLDERAFQDFDEQTEGLVSHELAHQWFGDLLTCKDWSQGWLNEGFATYFELLWQEYHRGWDSYRYYASKDAEEYFEEDEKSYRRPIVTRVYRDPIEVFDRHLYQKASLVLDMLRALLDDGPFFKALRYYAQRFRGDVVVTADFADALEEATGKNVEWFFDQWIMKGGHPELKVAYDWDDEKKLAKVAVRQTQQGDDVTPEVFRFPVEIGFRTARGDTLERVIVERREQTFTFPLPARPKLFRFDPGDRVLKRLELDLPRDLLLEQLANDPDAMLRIRAARALAKKASPEAIAALARSLLEDPFFGVRAEVAKALGEARGDAARAALLRGLKDVESSKARRAVVEALGEFRDEEVGAALRALLEHGDPSYAVEAEAACSLGKTRTKGAFEAIVKAMERPTCNDLMSEKVCEGLGELRDPRGIEVCMKVGRYGGPAWARGAAVLALGKLGREHQGRRDDIRDFIERLLLEDPWFRARVNCPKALERIGDAAAISALERAEARDLDGRVRRRAADAIRKLRKGLDAGDEVKRLRDEVERLREDNVKLRDRVDRLEARGEKERGG